jgi:periplasmic divalent cation tolerance protein
MKEKVIIALTTCPEAAAPGIADALVSERLAACVNQIPGVESTYSWQGSLTRDREALLVIKTTQARYAALSDRIQALHPYELPELITIPVESGAAAYLDWIRTGTQTGTEP